MSTSTATNIGSENIITLCKRRRAQYSITILPDEPEPQDEAVPAPQDESASGSEDGTQLLVLRPKAVERISVPRRLASFNRTEEEAIRALNNGSMTFPYHCPAISHKEFMERLHRLHPETLISLSKYTIHTRGHTSSIRMTYNEPPHVIARLKEQIHSGVNELAAMIPRSLPPHVKLQQLYAWFCQNITYNHVKHPYNYCAAGVFMRRTAVCAGIAQAFMLVCLRMGIPCGIVLGNTTMEAESTHCWNVVRLQDAYYHIDVTSGICFYAQIPKVTYPLFCVPESQLRKQRYIRHTSHLPESTECDFAHQFGQQFHTHSDVDNWIRTHLTAHHAITLSYPPQLWPTIEEFRQYAVLVCQSMFPGMGMHTMVHADNCIIISMD